MTAANGPTAGSQTQRRPVELAPIRAQSAAESPKMRRTLNFNQVCEKLGVKARKGRMIVAEPWFPDPIELGPRCLRWVDSEIDEALASRAPRRPEPAPEPAQLQRGKVERLKREGVPA